jgi:membrane-bound metal-dependent hydrolase YbcI (DUF457 family)
MLLLGHVGITFGAALAADTLTSRQRSAASNARPSALARVRQATTSLSRRVDLRLLLIGSMLPDLIDKPVGLILFAETFSNGRLFAHSLSFATVLAIAGALQWHFGKRNHLLVLAYATAMHLVLDAMWHTPATFFWPFAGPIPRGTVSSDWLARIFETLLTNPAAYLSEIAGAILLVPLLWAILGRIGVIGFLRYGRVE